MGLKSISSANPVLAMTEIACQVKQDILYSVSLEVSFLALFGPASISIDSSMFCSKAIID
jgi:hypothetical protein